ncbi:hypothetical protein FQZ97_723830 [compost metagenome]
MSFINHTKQKRLPKKSLIIALMIGSLWRTSFATFDMRLAASQAVLLEGKNNKDEQKQ